jgi:hypothetical protein
MTKYISIFNIILCSFGIFFGFYYLETNPEFSIKIVTLTTVGIAGIFAFIRHVIFYKSDSKRLGWETDRPDWMFEVGFANLAFGAIGFIVVLADWGIQASALVLIGFAFYLFQAVILHLYRYLTDIKKSPERLWRSVILTTFYVVMMTIFIINSLTKNKNL